MRIGAILPSGFELPARFFIGLSQFADERSNIEIVHQTYRYSEEPKLPKGFGKLDGVVLWSDRSDRWVHNLIRQGVKVANCNLDWAETLGIVSLSNDLEATSRTIADHLMHGRESSFAVIVSDPTGRPQTTNMCERLVSLASAAWRSTAVMTDAPAVMDEKHRLMSVSSEHRLLHFLRSLPTPAAIYCENDYLARLVCNAAELIGRQVPRDFAIMGSGDYRIATAHRPTLTTLPRGSESVGYEAARVVAEWIESGGPQPADRLLTPPPIIVRQSTSAPDLTQNLILSAMRIIETDACRGLTVDSLCDRLGLSKVTVSARFQTTYGISPGAKIRDVKLQRAKRLLNESKRTVAEIATELGFEDQSKFGKFFKREAGMTPSAFRRATATHH